MKLEQSFWVYPTHMVFLQLKNIMKRKWSL